jgi:Domain of unknown function DUF29
MIILQRRELRRLIEKNPDLKSIEAAEFIEAYETARLTASAETHIELDIFPEQPPYTIKQSKDDTFWPI